MASNRASLFRKTLFRGAKCFIVRTRELRRVLFRRRIVAFQIFDTLIFKDERTFRRKHVRCHEHEHYVQWRQSGDKYCMRYSAYANADRFHNPFEEAAWLAAYRKRVTKLRRGAAREIRDPGKGHGRRG